MITRLAPRAARLVRNARRRAGLTQRALAVRSGVPQPTIAAIEGGRQDPRFSTLLRLLRASGAEVETVAKPGEGIDVSLIDEQLRLSPAQRLDRAGADARGLERFLAGFREPRKL